MLSIVIPTKDRPAILNRTIGSVVEATEEMDAEILVINDSKTQEVNFQQHAKVKVLKSGKGSAAISRNLGAKHAKGEVLLFLDDDIVIDKETLNALYTKTLRSENTIFLPNWIYPEELNNKLGSSGFGRFVIKYNYNNLRGYLGKKKNIWNNDTAFEHTGIASYCLMMRKELFNSLNGYCEDFSFAGFEDHDMTRKLQDKKVKIFIEPKHIVLHNEEDKLQPESWLERNERAAITRKQAVKIGYSELELHYSGLKSWVFKNFYKRKSFFTAFLRTLPNSKLFDFIYFFLFKTLMGAYIHKGYTSLK